MGGALERDLGGPRGIWRGVTGGFGGPGGGGFSREVWRPGGLLGTWESLGGLQGDWGGEVWGIWGGSLGCLGGGPWGIWGSHGGVCGWCPWGIWGPRVFLGGSQVPALELTPLCTPGALPPTLAHGTRRRCWAPIRAGGLARMGRTHIHLAGGLPGDPGPPSGERPGTAGGGDGTGHPGVREPPSGGVPGARGTPPPPPPISLPPPRDEGGFGDRHHHRRPRGAGG